ncbi:hypothetical protein CI105_06980 [Candidatus Izimaplasma bacterium ZiA1]|uniref:ATP-binding cassette domain-containing protein n=1 Tax=Candidatus Izimoplasma sp. ZiA1 TaxID=2024899 RepID=UPI000BAA8C85|nr:hypothetical protein CI105_06980 [Candidatus Izimaplasma bacterium ZiA1]
MLNIKNISIRKISEDRELIKNLSFVLNQNDKFAIIGLEGNGKSTLLKAILNKNLIDYCEISGEIYKEKIKIGYLEQNIKEVWQNETVIDFLLKEDINSEIEPDSYLKLALLDKMLNQIKFNLEMFDENRKISKYSGGEVVKLGLVKILINEPDVLFLDEPTNDLDLETILFLEDFILNESRPILFISHDEALLKNTANGIIHLTQINKKRIAKSFFKKCSYTEYTDSYIRKMNQDEMLAKKQRSDFKKKMEKFRKIYQSVEYLQNQTVRDPSAARLLKKKVKSLKSTEKRFEKEKEDFIDIPENEEEINIFYSDMVNIPKNKVIIDLKIDKLMMKNKILSKNIELFVKGPQKIAIIGKNGCGKTTLLKTIYNNLCQRSDLTIGYMGQNYDEQLNSDLSALEILLSDENIDKVGKVRKMMGALNFTREEMLYPQTSLSGGQKAKLLLLKTVIEDANVLILDEPTRNLSPLSIPVIHNLFNTYKGSIISVTHDRSFIDNCFDEIYFLDENGLKKI